LEHSNNLARANLLSCFFTECERNFRFLDQAYGYSYIGGLQEQRGRHKIIKPYYNQGVEKSFTALTRYERGNQVIELVFGAEHYLLEGYVYYDPVQRFEFSEVLAAAKKNDVGASCAWGLMDEGALAKTIDRIADAVRRYTNYFTNADDKLIKRAHIIRSKRMEQAVRKQFEAQMEYACALAAKAFWERDYFKVVEFLEPLEGYLGRSDLKKLHLARKYLQA
jgi:hypothetical protein